VTPELPLDLLARGHVRAETDGPVLHVTLDRPDARNAQTPATWAALSAIGEVCAAGGVDVVVFRGAGTAFSAGLDRRMFTPEGIPGETSLAEMVTMSDAEMADRIAEFQRAFLWQRELPVLTIAAVQGPAVGAGFQLALACDILLATPAATFAMRESSYGLVPDLGGTQPLVRAVGYSRAVDICATGRTVTADEGLSLGFVTRVVADLETGVEEVVVAVGSAPRGAIADLLPLLRGAEAASRDGQAAAERHAQVGRLRALLGGG
jgi:enoyl-CoA hydratase/carnithine racemase